MTSTEPPKAAAPSLWRAIFFASLLVTLDAFILNQGGLSLLVGLWLVVVSVPRTFLARRYASVRAPRLRNIAVYFGAVVMVFVLNAVNDAIAQSRAESLVAAVKAFRDRHQRYPASLQELVPDYIERVPLAKYTFTYNRFRYATSDAGTTLYYVILPPFGGRLYSFTRNEWRSLD